MIPTVEVERRVDEDPNVSLGLMVEEEEDREGNPWWIHGEGMGTVERGREWESDQGRGGRGRPLRRLHAGIQSGEKISLLILHFCRLLKTPPTYLL